MKKALNLTILTARGISQQEAIPMIRDAGFQGCFYVAEPGQPVKPTAELAGEAGLFMEFVHAPVKGVDKLWQPGEAGENKLRELIHWVQECSESEIPWMISHVWTKYDPVEPGQLGIDRFGTLLDRAQQAGVKIAFENAEVSKFLTAVRKGLWTHPAAGFCFDTGHELCYTDGKDQLEEFGDKLLCTHLNDNMGRTGPVCTSADDAHMMPFDGKVDWNRVADRLKKLHFQGPLTFELKMGNKPGRHTHDRYLPLGNEEILALAYEKAVQFEKMMESPEENP